MNIISRLESASSIIILGHHNADPDAICSMIAFKELYKSIRPDGLVSFACDDISRVAVQVMNTFYGPIEIINSIDEDPDLYVLLDTNSRYQLGPTLENSFDCPDKTIVIDHHEENPDIEKITTHAIVESDRFSTCEILVSLFQDLRVEFSSKIANLLLTGILFDTRRFFYADQRTLEAAIHLIESGADYLACVESLIIRPDRSERIARLKAAGRLRVYDIHGWVIVISKIGAYEASACRGLIDLGADVAIIGGKQAKDKVRLSSRSTSEFFRETGVNLGTDVMEPLGEIIGGEGGGHANAAGANGTRNREEALLRSVELIREAIEKRNPSDCES